jgi:membrane fusion protein (multidrug efflux system)
LFPNPGNILRPGQFGRVRIVTRTKENALLVPQRAVTELQGGYQVAVLGSDNKVEIRPIKVAERVGTQWIIEQGLKPGERVVAEGIQRVREGMTVTPTPFTVQAETKPAAAAEAQRK